MMLSETLLIVLTVILALLIIVSAFTFIDPFMSVALLILVVIIIYGTNATTRERLGMLSFVLVLMLLAFISYQSFDLKWGYNY